MSISDCVLFLCPNGANSDCKYCPSDQEVLWWWEPLLGDAALIMALCLLLGDSSRLLDTSFPGDIGLPKENGDKCLLGERSLLGDSSLLKDTSLFGERCLKVEASRRGDKCPWGDTSLLGDKYRLDVGEVSLCSEESQPGDDSLEGDRSLEDELCSGASM